MKPLASSILGTLLIIVVGYHAAVGIACLYMTTPIVTQEPTEEDIANYVRRHRAYTPPALIPMADAPDMSKLAETYNPQQTVTVGDEPN